MIGPGNQSDVKHQQKVTRTPFLGLRHTGVVLSLEALAPLITCTQRKGGHSKEHVWAVSLWEVN